MKKKLKFQNTTIQDGTGFMDSLPQEAEESINGTQLSVQRKPEERSTSLSDELTFIRTMTREELSNHIQKCLEMSTENKITPKNAFALQLIDCMNLLLKKEDFSVMACTLDAGQKIYAHRVDSLHQQVIKLAEEVVNNQKNKESDGENSDEKMIKEKIKTNKKNILATRESLRRTLKCKDPKEKFITIDGLPGAIMSSVRRDPKDLSITLENNISFWHDRENYKPLTVNGTVTIPHCEIYRDSNEITEKNDLQWFSPTQEKTNIVVKDTLNASPEELSDDTVMDECFSNDLPIDTQESDDNELGEREEDMTSAIPMDTQENDVNKISESEVDVISTAMKHLNNEAQENEEKFAVPLRFEAMKMIFNQVSDYHYLNMEKAYYWTGPEFWKRPKCMSLDSKIRKPVLRKKRDPHLICYTGSEVEEKLSAFLKKGSTLNKKTIMGWKMKNVTYATDLKIGVEQFLDLFHMSALNEDEETPETVETEMNTIELETKYDYNDSLEDNGMSDSEDPLNSCFYENAPENVGSPDHGDPLNSAFYDAGLTQKSEKITEEAGKVIKVQFCSTDNSETTLVPAPKTVNFQPIKYKTKPIRVDMQHLKQTMWKIIKEDINKNVQDRVNCLSNLETPPATMFSSVLCKLPPKLEKRTAEDLFPGMALLALLTLANENNLQLKNCENNSDIMIRLEN